MKSNFLIHSKDLVPAIESLESYFKYGGTSIIQAAFQHTYFVHPEAVSIRTPYFPERARYSREYYPGIARAKPLPGSPGTGREIILDDNSRAQIAWERYTGSRLARRSGYGVRHIWGNAHSPDAFTAGWNLCYMPFWAGMLTEDQHPHPSSEPQFGKHHGTFTFPVTRYARPPDFVSNQEIDLADLLDGNPLKVLRLEP